MIGRAAAALSLAVLFGTANAVPDRALSAAVRKNPPNLCLVGERAVYSCRFGGKSGSVCLGKNSIHYRFGRGNRPELDLANTADWGNIHIGGNRSQGGLNQDHIRFTNRDTHYVVHSGETGSLNERPGRRLSGIAVLQGSAGQSEVAHLQCKQSAAFDSAVFSAISSAAPDGWDGEEASGGPFDVIY